MQRNRRKEKGTLSPFSIYQLEKMQVETRVKELVEEKIADRPELFLVDVKMLPNNKLIIHVDGDEGISIQDCVAISRHVGFHLEEENAIAHAYNLEVSSPGVGEPLKLNRQYTKNIGRTIGLKLTDGNKKEGVLLEVTEENLVINEQVKEKGKKAVQAQSNVAFNDITEAKILISFK